MSSPGEHALGRSARSLPPIASNPENPTTEAKSDEIVEMIYNEEPVAVAANSGLDSPLDKRGKPRCGDPASLKREPVGAVASCTGDTSAPCRRKLSAGSTPVYGPIVIAGSPTDRYIRSNRSRLRKKSDRGPKFRKLTARLCRSSW
jgi:hypothetical protein